MTDRTEFLLACLAEDCRPDDLPHHPYCAAMTTNDDGEYEFRGDLCDCGVPQRVLAWCAAMRAIVELHRGNHECSNEDDSCAWVLDGDCDTNWHLAKMWADHPDFDPAWNR